MIKFVNHASVIIEGNGKSILTDPWYEGDVFNKGWKLLVENKTKEINDILDSINYIWISHEHPDHFSIGFFKKYKDKIISNSIKILFQKTKDKRVITFLKNLSFDVIEIKENEKFKIAQNFYIKIAKDGFYDSALIINLNETVIFNINDCNLNNVNKIKKFYNKFGYCDILLSQFSYAAWKGGKENTKWRKEAALEKLNSLYLQSEIFKSKFVIPIASYIYFANSENFYLNDASNSPADVLNFFNKKGKNKKVVLLKNYQKFVPSEAKEHLNVKALKFWNNILDDKDNLNIIHYKSSIDIDELKKLYFVYRTRIRHNNSITLIKFLSLIKLGGFFQDNKIFLYDLQIGININIAFGNFELITKEECIISMHSSSFIFIMKNPFGFDTLTVNGCFEELQNNGFVNIAKTFSIENLNGMGIKFTPMIIFNFELIFEFFRRLWSVSIKLKLKKT